MAIPPYRSGAMADYATAASLPAATRDAETVTIQGYCQLFVDAHRDSSALLDDLVATIRRGDDPEVGRMAEYVRIATESADLVRESYAQGIADLQRLEMAVTAEKIAGLQQLLSFYQSFQQDQQSLREKELSLVDLATGGLRTEHATLKKTLDSHRAECEKLQKQRTKALKERDDLREKTRAAGGFCGSFLPSLPHFYAPTIDLFPTDPPLIQAINQSLALQAAEGQDAQILAQLARLDAAGDPRILTLIRQIRTAVQGPIRTIAIFQAQFEQKRQMHNRLAQENKSLEAEIKKTIDSMPEIRDEITHIQSQITQLKRELKTTTAHRRADEGFSLAFSPLGFIDPCAPSGAYGGRGGTF